MSLDSSRFTIIYYGLLFAAGMLKKWSTPMSVSAEPYEARVAFRHDGIGFNVMKSTSEIWFCLPISRQLPSSIF
jgi:hypothetical protein